MIWRVEVWAFEKPEETWVKEQGGDLFAVLHRERIQKTEFDKKSVTLDPALGGVQLTDKQETWNSARWSCRPTSRAFVSGKGRRTNTRPRPRGGRRWRKSTVGDS